MFDTLIVGCDQHIGNGTAGHSPLIDMLNHRLPVQLDERLAREP
jgi:hypothetical protein